MYFDGGEFGVAIISRFPLTNVVTHPTPGGRQLYLEALANVAGEPHTVFATHWDFGNAAMAAKDQFLTLQAASHPPVILGGDFNSGAGAAPYDLLVQGLTRAGMAEVADVAQRVETQPDGSPCDHPIDHIFVQGPYDVTSVDACLPSNDVTDHPFLLATLTRND